MQEALGSSPRTPTTQQDETREEGKAQHRMLSPQQRLQTQVLTAPLPLQFTGSEWYTLKRWGEEQGWAGQAGLSQTSEGLVWSKRPGPVHTPSCEAWQKTVGYWGGLFSRGNSLLSTTTVAA